MVDHVRALKPYKGGSAALRGVHDLDIMDKHRELIPTTGMVMIEFMGAGGDVEHMRADRMIAGFGTEAEAALASGLTPDTTIPSTFELTFEWNSPFQTKELIPTLHSLVEEFTGVVDSFEAICFGTIREKHSAT